MNPGCTLIAFLKGKPEKRNELLQVLRDFVKPTRAEAGCVEYHLHVSDADPNLFFFYENWRSKRDLDEHLDMPYLKVFLRPTNGPSGEGDRSPIHDDGQRL